MAPAGLIVRRATPADLHDVVRLGIAGLEHDAYPGLLIDRSKVVDVARHAISSPSDYVGVGELNGQVVAAVTAVVGDMLFHERKQATVLQFWTEVPGCGLPVMRAFLRWARARPIIKSIVFTVEHGADPRIGRMLERLGLRMALPVYMETR